MKTVKPEALAVGSLFYECGSGLNIECVATSPAIRKDLDDGRAQWSWTARNTQTGEVIDYLRTEGFDAYGPSLYSAPAYCRVKEEGQFSYPLVGSSEDFDLEDEGEARLRDPDILQAWVDAMGSDRPGVPLSEWLKSHPELLDPSLDESVSP